MAEVNFVRFAKGLEQHVYVAVGFAVLGFQRAQVHRQAWQRRFFSPPAPAQPAPLPAPSPVPLRQAVAGVAGDAAERLGPLVFEVAGMAAERVGPLVADTVERLGPFMSDAAERLGPLMSDAAERLGPLVSDTVERLPPEAHELFEAAGDLISDLPDDPRQIAREAVAFGRFALEALWAPTSRPTRP